MSGIRWAKPDYNEIAGVMRDLAQGPVAPLTVAELVARGKYIDGDPALLCSGAIKEYSNLLALGDAEAARVKRILMADAGRIDAAKVIAKVCVDNIGWSCP
jgi:hypothetical protein